MGGFISDRGPRDRAIPGEGVPGWTRTRPPRATRRCARSGVSRPSSLWHRSEEVDAREKRLKGHDRLGEPLNSRKYGRPATATLSVAAPVGWEAELGESADRT